MFITVAKLVLTSKFCNHFTVEERASRIILFTAFVFSLCFVSLLRGAMGWSVATPDHTYLLCCVLFLYTKHVRNIYLPEINPCQTILYKQ